MTDADLHCLLFGMLGAAALNVGIAVVAFLAFLLAPRDTTHQEPDEI